MSASREKQNRQNKTNSGWVDPKLTREEDQKNKDKHSNVLYAVIGIVFVLAVVVAMIWNSHLIQRNSTAVVIDGEEYTASEVTFYYQNTYASFINQFNSILSFLGFDTSVSLKDQTLNETAAVMLETEEGITWHEYLLRETFSEMASVQNARKLAEEEGFVYPANVALQHETSMVSLESLAAANGLSHEAYLFNMFGADMSVEVYDEHLLNTLQYEAYMSAHRENLTYSAEELEEAYKLDPRSYDSVSYEYLAVSGDVDDSISDPTEEDKAAAMEAAKKTAEELLAKYESGTAMALLTNEAEGVRYIRKSNAAYGGDVVTTWLFDGTRKAGECEVVEGSSTYYVLHLIDRFREDYNTVNVRHVLIKPEAGTIAEGEDGYEAEQETLKAAAKAEAEKLLAEWKSNGATEDAFSQMAKDHSDDSSSVVGGLYSNIYKGQMVSEFEDWCFDSTRKTGDTDIVETMYGYHIMFFSGEDLPRWEHLVTEDISTEDTFGFITSLSENSVIERRDFGMKFVG